MPGIARGLIYDVPPLAGLRVVPPSGAKAQMTQYY
jgi:hypothetical protein